MKELKKEAKKIGRPVEDLEEEVDESLLEMEL